MNAMFESPQTVEWQGTTYKTILSSKDSGGAMSILECENPIGSGPPRHVHANEDEIFILLSGHCEFWLDGQTVLKQAGDTMFVPRGHEHTFRVVGTEPSRHLTILTPGGFEGFFVEMARNAYAIPADMAAVVATGANFGLTFTGPPLGAG